MKLLLDTHIWLWSRRDPKLLGRRVLAELENESNELWLSPVSSWEALLLHRKGRIALHSDPIEWIRQMVAGFREAPLTHEVVVTAEALPLLNPDPADRFFGRHGQGDETYAGDGRQETAWAGRYRYAGQPLITAQQPQRRCDFSHLHGVTFPARIKL